MLVFGRSARLTIASGGGTWRPSPYKQPLAPCHRSILTVVLVDHRWDTCHKCPSLRWSEGCGGFDCPLCLHHSPNCFNAPMDAVCFGLCNAVQSTTTLMKPGIYIMQDGKAPPEAQSAPQPTAEAVQWVLNSHTSAATAERHLQQASVSTEELQEEARSGARRRASLCIAPQEASDVIQATSQPKGSPLPSAHLLPFQLLAIKYSQLIQYNLFHADRTPAFDIGTCDPSSWCCMDTPGWVFL